MSDFLNQFSGENYKKTETVNKLEATVITKSIPDHNTPYHKDGEPIISRSGAVITAPEHDIELDKGRMFKFMSVKGIARHIVFNLAVQGMKNPSQRPLLRLGIVASPCAKPLGRVLHSLGGLTVYVGLMSEFDSTQMILEISVVFGVINYEASRDLVLKDQERYNIRNLVNGL